MLPGQVRRLVEQVLALGDESPGPLLVERLAVERGATWAALPVGFGDERGLPLG
jgi:hypothetical protein